MRVDIPYNEVEVKILVSTSITLCTVFYEAVRCKKKVKTSTLESTGPNKESPEIIVKSEDCTDKLQEGRKSRRRRARKRHVNRSTSQENDQQCCLGQDFPTLDSVKGEPVEIIIQNIDGKQSASNCEVEMESSPGDQERRKAKPTAKNTKKAAGDGTKGAEERPSELTQQTSNTSKVPAEHKSKGHSIGKDSKVCMALGKSSLDVVDGMVKSVRVCSDEKPLPAECSVPKKETGVPQSAKIGGGKSEASDSQDRSKVLAEREARKQAKLAAKNAKKSTATGGTAPEKVDIVDGEVPLSVHTSVQVCSSAEFPMPESKIKVEMSSVRGLETWSRDELVVEEFSNVETIKIETDTPKKTETGGVTQEAFDVQEKSKVLAEREARKQAKMMAKSQKRTSKVVEDGVASRVAKDESSQGPLRNSAGKNEDGKSKEEKSKAELRAERRAKQEAQRAAKAAEKQPKTAKKDESAKENKKPLSSTNTGRKEGAVLVAKKELKREKKSDPAMNSLRLFSHLHYKTKPTVMLATSNIHPAIVELGVKYASRVVFGSNARCVALLQAVKQLINDYTTPREKDFGRGLETQLGLCTSYLNASRPMSVSMTNALRHLKTHLTQLPNNIQDNEARAKLCDVIDTYIKDQIEVAGVAICRSVKKKIANGDVILIYACSSLLYQILVESHRADTKFSVVVVDSAPWFEGREMVRRLVSKGLRCTYVLINSISFIMRQVTKVLVGAHALLANGYVMSRAGCSLVALVAHAYNVPVLVCCETYKFCERVQTDAFVFNELGTVEDMAPPGSLLSQHLALPCLSPLSILYDVTPPDLVTAVVTEVAILPCTSVPVILRIGLSDIPS